jgi:bla regulator protein BlaR1
MVGSVMTILDELGAGFCRHALMMLIQSSILIAVLLVLDLLLRRRVRAVIRYSIWMLVFVKLVLPPTLCLPTGAGYWLGDYLPVDSGVLERSESGGSESGKLSVSAFVIPGGPYAPPSDLYSDTAVVLNADDSGSPGVSRQAIIFLVWLVGVLLLSALLLQRVCFVRGLVAQSERVKGGLDEKLNECRRQVGIRRTVELRISQAALSPATCGLLRPKIMLPASMLARLSAAKLRTVLIHELAHIKRGDLWVNFAQNILQVVYFHNPLLWLANAVVRRVREQAVDEMVLASLGDQARSYSKTLVDIAEMAFLRPSLGLRLIGVVESKKALAGRIRHITTRPFPKTARLGIRGVVVVLIVAAVLLPMAKAENEHGDAHLVVAMAAAGPRVQEQNPKWTWRLFWRRCANRRGQLKTCELGG